MVLKSKSHTNFFSYVIRPILKTYGLYFEIPEEQTRENEYLFKRSHLLLDSVHKSPLYYKTKRNKTFHLFHMNQEKMLRYICSG